MNPHSSSDTQPNTSVGLGVLVDEMVWMSWSDLLRRATDAPDSLSPWSVDQIEQIARVAPDLRAWLHEFDMTQMAPMTTEVLHPIRRLIEAGGKRLRPSFVAWGHHAATGREATADQLESEDLAHAAAAVEMVTGKGVSDDLRDGKASLLLVRATRLAAPADRSLLAACLGDPELDVERADQCRDAVAASGALTSIEYLINAQVEKAECALDTLAETAPPQALSALNHLAYALTYRVA